MAWLFFMDESGHDHRHMPYEVRGGFAIYVGRLWPFAQDMQRLETDCFGCRLQEYGKEIKGSTLIDRKRVGFAREDDCISDQKRKDHCRSFLAHGCLGKRQSRGEFTAYGQACLLMARGIFDLLKRHGAVVMASATPRGVKRPPDYRFDHYLRKDAVFLFERFFRFLEAKWEHGVPVMDETDKQEDRRFVARMERYLTRTDTGRERTAWIVPTPFFVSSHGLRRPGGRPVHLRHQLGLSPAQTLMFAGQNAPPACKVASLRRATPLGGGHRGVAQKLSGIVARCARYGFQAAIRRSTPLLVLRMELLTQQTRHGCRAPRRGRRHVRSGSSRSPVPRAGSTRPAGVRKLGHLPCARSLGAAAGDMKKEATPRPTIPRIMARALRGRASTGQFEPKTADSQCSHHRHRRRGWPPS